MEEKDKVISFKGELDDIGRGLCEVNEKKTKVNTQISDMGQKIEDTTRILQELSGDRILLDNSEETDVEEDIEALDNVIDSLSGVRLKGDIRLTAPDLVVGIIAGIIASVVDIVFVGTPEIVKIYKGGENFDGSILTGALRKIGNGNDKLSEMLKWLSEKCKVPYDIPAKKGVVYPNNHRLRSFAHDPLIGLLFAVVDIILGTATVVDDNGRLRVLINSREYPASQKYLAVVYYLGHLLSDVCTARGLPVPGFIMTQFLSGDDKSIARIAEQMYIDGYDLRHLASMETSVLIKNMITDAYCRICTPEAEGPVETIAEKQIRENKQEMYRYKLRLVSDAVSCSGNVLKFFIPPTMGNMTALNLPEWISLIKDTIINFKYQLRDRNVEKVLANRDIISDNWYELLGEKK